MCIPLPYPYRILPDLMLVCLFLGVAPEILRSPSNVSAIVDRNLTLTCTVDGHPVPDIFWQKRDISTNRWEQIIRGANSNRFRMPHGRLIIRRLLIIDTGYYRCSALNKIGSAYSGLAYLSVQGTCTWHRSLIGHSSHLLGSFCWALGIIVVIILIVVTLHIAIIIPSSSSSSYRRWHHRHHLGIIVIILPSLASSSSPYCHWHHCHHHTSRHCCHYHNWGVERQSG